MQEDDASLCFEALKSPVTQFPVRTTASHPRLSGRVIFLEAISVPSSPHQLP